MKKTTLAVVASTAILVTSITGAYAVSESGNAVKVQVEAQDAETYQRRAQIGKCAEGYSATQTKVDGKSVVYECVKVLRCLGEFKPDDFEVVDTGSSIIQRYKCSMRDKAQLINIPAD